MLFAHRVLCVVAVCAYPAMALGYDVKASSNGSPLHWPASDVDLTLSFTPSPPEIDLDTAAAAATTAVASWDAALDGTGVVLGTTTGAGTATVHDGTDGINMVRWALDHGDPDIEKGVLALTFVSYRASDGTILDADIVINAADFKHTVSLEGCTNQYDLVSTLTHEVGHFVGMAHSIGHPEATMFATGTACDIGKRDLSVDDLDGLASLYAAPAESSGCAAGRASTFGMVFVVIAVAFAVLGRRSLKIAVIVACAGVVTLLVATANASQLRHLDVAELGRSAVLVIRGHVVAVAPAADGQLATDTTIVVETCLAGSCPPTLEVRRRGGEHDGVGLWVDSEAELAVGADVVTYLRVDRDGRFRVLGGVQGAWRIVRFGLVSFGVRDLRGQHVSVDGRWQPGSIEVISLGEIERSVAPQ